MLCFIIICTKRFRGKLKYGSITEDEWTRYEGYYDKMLERNAKMNEKLDF